MDLVDSNSLTVSLRVVPLSVRRDYRPAEGKVVLPDVLGEEEGPKVTAWRR